MDDVVSEWKEFQPGEDIIVRFTHPVVRLVVRLHDGTPVTTAAFRTQCQFAPYGWCYEARIGNDPNVRTGTVVISDEVTATLRPAW